MNLSGHIDDLKHTQSAKRVERDNILCKAADEDRTLDNDEHEAVTKLADEIEELNSDISIYEKAEADQMASSRPISTGPNIITDLKRDEDFEGQNFTRVMISKAIARLDSLSPVAVAQKRWGQKAAQLVETIKADVTGGGTQAGQWGSELVSMETYNQDFINYLYAQTVYNKLPLREVPANVKIKGQDGASAAYWVGESKSIPVTSSAYFDVELKPLKVAAVSVISNELLRDSTPSAERLVRDALVNAGAQRIDQTFVSAAAANAGVSPAGILYGTSPLSSAGTDEPGVISDATRLLQYFVDAKNASGLFFVASPSTALAISMMRNALDQYSFPGLSERGGEFLSIPMVTGENVSSDALILLKPSDIYRIAMGTVEMSLSDTATIEMDDSPTSDTDTPAAASGKTVSMFQTESTAFKMVQSINFARRRESCVAWLNNVNYGASPASV